MPSTTMFGAALGLALALAFSPAPAAAQNADMNEALPAAYYIATSDTRVLLMTPGAGGYDQDGFQPFRLTAFFADRDHNGQKVAWEDILAGVNCTTAQVFVASTSVYTAEGAFIATSRADALLPVQAGTVNAIVKDIICADHRPSQLAAQTRQIRLRALNRFFTSRARSAQ